MNSFARRGQAFLESADVDPPKRPKHVSLTYATADDQKLRTVLGPLTQPAAEELMHHCLRAKGPGGAVRCVHVLDHVGQRHHCCMNVHTVTWPAQRTTEGTMLIRLRTKEVGE